MGRTYLAQYTCAHINLRSPHMEADWKAEFFVNLFHPAFLKPEEES